ncbi:MAG: hypothetical protein ACLR0F_04850 [Eisenbergiella sp.]
MAKKKKIQYHYGRTEEQGIVCDADPGGAVYINFWLLYDSYMVIAFENSVFKKDFRKQMGGA